MSGWRPFPVKPGDWVTVLPLDQHAGDVGGLRPGARNPFDMQPGSTYQVDYVSRSNVRQSRYIVESPAGPSGFLGWCRPATPEEIAQAQLSQLQAGGL